MTIWHKHNTAQECKILAIAPIANNIVSIIIYDFDFLVLSLITILSIPSFFFLELSVYKLL